MTTPTDIRRLLARIANNVNIAETRLHHATQALTLKTADGHPTTTSGRPTGPHGTNELTPTEAAAHTNLGDLYGYNDTPYHPGPTTQLDDIADHLKAALTALTHAHTAITNCGIPPLITQQHRCPGINSQGCTNWQDTDPTTGTPRRPDRLCLDCGRQVDSNRRRLRRHKAAS